MATNITIYHFLKCHPLPCGLHHVAMNLQQNVIMNFVPTTYFYVHNFLNKCSFATDIYMGHEQMIVCCLQRINPLETPDRVHTIIISLTNTSREEEAFLQDFLKILYYSLQNFWNILNTCFLGTT